MRANNRISAAVALAFTVLALARGPAVADSSSTASPVRIEGQRLSLQSDRLAFRELLEALQRSGRVTIKVQGDVSGLTISDSFENADVADALRRVLSTHSHLLIDRGMSGNAVRALEVILLAPRRDAGATSPPPNPVLSEVDDTGLVEAAIAEEQPPPVESLVDMALAAGSDAERAAAAEAIAYGFAPAGPTRGVADRVLTQMLSDPDEEVRGRALETLKDTADDVPVTALTQMAREDASADRRVQALELLAERAEPAALEPLRTALADPEPAVRQRARELIEDRHLPPDGR